MSAALPAHPREIEAWRMDMRYPERWMNDRRINRLSDSEHRAYVLALVWSVANGTDGVITVEDLELMPKPVTREALEGLKRAELVTEQLAAGELVWMLSDYESTQTTRAERESLETARRAKRDRQRAHRARAAVGGSGARAAEAGASVLSAVSDTALGQDRLGQDRTGQASSKPPTESEQVSWPVVSIPRSEPLPTAVGAEDDELY
jgi:hypothetical protein